MSPHPIVAISDEQAMLAYGAKLATSLTIGDCLALKGDLGMGKTVLARGIIQSLSPDPIQVQSPTFNLVQDYEVVLNNGQTTKLFHYDLYRIERPSELIELGIDEALEEGVVLIEWPEIAKNILPKETKWLEVTEVGEGRAIQFLDNI